MRIPCGGPLNLLKGQYHCWWTSVFLETITSGCWRIPAFSYPRAQVFIVSSFLKVARSPRRTLSRVLGNWKKCSDFKALIDIQTHLAFFAFLPRSFIQDESRSCGSFPVMRDRRLYCAGKDRAPTLRKALNISGGGCLSQEISGRDNPIDSPIARDGRLDICRFDTATR